MADYNIEYGTGGTITFHELSVTGESFISIKGPGVNIKGTKPFGDVSDDGNVAAWQFSHDLPEQASVGGKGLKVQFRKTEQGTDAVFKDYSLDVADVVGAKPLDFTITFDHNGNAKNLKIGGTLSSNGISISAGVSIDPHNPADASQLRSITIDPTNGTTTVTQYRISASHKSEAYVVIYSFTGETIFDGVVEIQPEAAAQISSGFLTPGSRCFLSDTPIQMWPLNPLIKPRADGNYDEQLVLSKVWEKPIRDIRVGDLVLSYDEQGRLQPGSVARTMTNVSTHILDFWGTGVTPGHAYYCADGPFKGQHVPLMDILRTDGAIMRADGTMLRAATNCEIGSRDDQIIQAIATAQKTDGSWTPAVKGQLRLGTRFLSPDGAEHVSVMDIAKRYGWDVSEDGHMVAMFRGNDGELRKQKFPFPYTGGSQLPKPEDFILQTSKVTLEEIYAAGEWEQISTQLSGPAANGQKKDSAGSATRSPGPTPNIPPAFVSYLDALNVSENPTDIIRIRSHERVGHLER